MMRYALLLNLTFALTLRASDEPPLRELNAEQLDYFLSAAFARYGHEPQRTIGLGRKAVRIRLDNTPKENSQAGIYSHFTLSGDFRVAADYNLIALPTVKTGYGMSYGLAVHTNGPSGAVFIARASHPEWGSCVIVTREIPGKDGKTYEATPYPSADMKGRLGLRREGDKIIAEVFDAAGTPRELSRFEKFGNAPITQIRIYADTGGAPGLMDGWFNGLTISADAIVGAALPPEPWWPWSTWVIVASALLLTAGMILIVRRKRRNRDAD